MNNWYKLDNAATIYPATLSHKWAAMFRISVTLDEKININLLREALNNTIKIFPNFHYQLKKGLFWCYFKYNQKKMVIDEDKNNPLLRMNFKENNDYLFRIRYFNQRIAIEYFHALTDGHAGITFFMTLIGEYLKLSKKITITYNDNVLDTKVTIPKACFKDYFFNVARKYTKFEHNKIAYHFTGTKLDNNLLKIITGHIKVDEIKKVSKVYNCTVTEFIASIMILVLQEMSLSSHNKKPIMVSIPIDLRKIYPIRTYRNFSSYVNVGINPKYGIYTLEEIIKEVKGQMALLINEKKVNAKISANVKAMKNVFIRMIPLFLKTRALSISEYLLGDRYCSINFSNIGLIDLPKEMLPYIKDANFIIGRPRFNACNSACISIKNDLYISFARKIKEPTFERKFFCKLVEMGINVEVESNGGI